MIIRLATLLSDNNDVVGLNPRRGVFKEGIIKLHGQQVRFHSVYASATRCSSSSSDIIDSGDQRLTDPRLTQHCLISIDNGVSITPDSVLPPERSIFIRESEASVGRLYEDKIARQRDMAKERQFTRSEIEQNDEDDTILIILHDKVYNVYNFLNEHPGGEEVLLDHKGKDGSEDFDDVGHSNDAMMLMKQYQVGMLVESDRTNQSPKQGWVTGYGLKEIVQTEGSDIPFYLFIGGIALAMTIIFYSF